MCIYIYIYIHIYISIYIYTHLYVCVCIYIYMHTCIFKCIHVYIHIRWQITSPVLFRPSPRVTYVYIFVGHTVTPANAFCQHSYTFIYIYLYIYIYVHIYIYMYIYIYSCVSHRYASDDAFFKMLAESFEVAAVPEDYLPDKLPAVSIFALKRLFPWQFWIYVYVYINICIYIFMYTYMSTPRLIFSCRYFCWDSRTGTWSGTRYIDIDKYTRIYVYI